MAKRGRPFKNPSIMVQVNKEVEAGQFITSNDILPVQPISRLRLLEVMKDQLKTPDGKAGITAVIVAKSYLNEMAEDVDDATLQNIIFKQVRDGDERAIVRRFFSNLDD